MSIREKEQQREQERQQQSSYGTGQHSEIRSQDHAGSSGSGLHQSGAQSAMSGGRQGDQQQPTMDEHGCE